MVSMTILFHLAPIPSAPIVLYSLNDFITILWLMRFLSTFGSGLIEEYDSPRTLLENKSSSFAQLVAEYTVRSNSSL
jgi:hypothetical protein